jgi:hypothetical protein
VSEYHAAVQLAGMELERPCHVCAFFHSRDYVYVQCPPPDIPLEVARTEEGLDIAGQAPLLGQALAPWLHGTGPHPPVSIGNPVGSGSVRIVSSSLGLGAEYGTVVAGSQRVDFPTETESLLLALGTNQAALMFARLRAEAAVQQAYTELEHRVQEILAAHGGQVSVESGRGQGTTFTLTLAHRAEAPGAPGGHSAPSTQQGP